MKISTLKPLKQQMSEEQCQSANKDALEKFAIYEAEKIYGDILDDRIDNRLVYEMEELSKCCDLDVVIDAAEAIKNKEKDMGKLYLSRLSQSNSLLFYLLGLGSVNPLPRHTYCAKCHTFYWGKRKTDLCECCGESLIEDGYDLPFEPLLDEIKRNGLRFDFSSTKSHKHANLPIRYFENDLIELAKELGFTQEEIEKNDVSWEDAKMVMKYLTLPCEKSKPSFYTKKYKKRFVCNHHPYIGIPDLGTNLLEEVFNIYFECYESFDDFIKVMAMIHGTGVIKANDEYVCDFIITNLIEDAIATRDELYNFLIKSQVSKDDALLICRETRLCGKGHLSKLSEFKLREAGVDEKYIDFMRNISYTFHKAHIVAHTRLAIKIAKIYIAEPLRYYKAYFTVNKEKLFKMDKKYDFIRGLSESKSTDMEEVYLAAIDLIERGYNPEALIKEVLSKK